MKKELPESPRLQYEEFGPRMDRAGKPVKLKWRKQLKAARKELWSHIKCSAVFTSAPERGREWRAFFKAFPWKGLQDLQQAGRQALPPFSVPDFPKPVTAQSRQLLDAFDEAGEDADGFIRYRFKEGRDMAVYKVAQSTVTFGGKVCGPKGTWLKKAPRRGQ